MPARRCRGVERYCHVLSFDLKKTVTRNLDAGVLIEFEAVVG